MKDGLTSESASMEESMRSTWIGICFILWVFITPVVYAGDTPSVEMFSPQGTVKIIRQVSVRFSEQMVPFGDPRALLEPFEINCSEKGTSHWVDQKNWVYDFDKDLPAGIRCEFMLKPGLKTLSGEEVKGRKAFSFSTGGPAIKSSVPYEGAQGIDEEQIFFLTLDAEPDEASVIQNVFFSIEGIQDHVGIKIISGKEREEILKALFRHRKAPAVPMVFIQCKQRFPSEAKVSLIWGRGMMSRTGVATDQDQVLRFQVRKAFSAEFNCEREHKGAGCIPLKSMDLFFSAAISKDQADRIIMKAPDGKILKPQSEGEEEIGRVLFKGPFPENTSFVIELPPGIKDVTGRPLINADKFPLTVRTEKYPPLAKFSARFGILELKPEPVLPVTMRNLEPEVRAKMLKVDQGEGVMGKVMGRVLNVEPRKGESLQAWLRKVASATRGKSLLGSEKGARDFNVPKPMGPSAFEVVGIPFKDPGLYVVELESRILGRFLLGSPRPMYVPTAVLVTNLSVHFKWGRESSLVWVTTLDAGSPVKEAMVTVKDCQEKILWQGKTDANGIARIEGALPSAGDLPQCNYQTDSYDYPQMGALHSLGGGLFVTAQTAGDMAFVHSSWDDGIEAWNFNLPEESSSDPFIAHTVFDRTLLRAGETVHMKHFFRQHTMKGFSEAPRPQMPDTVSVGHDGSGQKYEFPLKWDASGIAETSWTIPKEAKLGFYEVSLMRKAGTQLKGNRRREAGEWTSGRFRVEEFRVPLLKGIIQPPIGPLINVEEVPLDLSVQYLAGGGAGLLPIRLRSEVRTKAISPFEGFEDFTFSNGPVKEGLLRRGTPMEGEEPEGEVQRGAEKREIKLPTLDLVLDKSGSTRTTIPKLPKAELPKEIVTEMEFQDPNGEIQTVSARIPLWHSKYLVGVMPDSWTLSKEALKAHAAVVDLSGKPVPGATVKVDLYEKKTYTHRKRLVGGFYAYEHSTEIKKVVNLCQGKTDSKGLLICEGKSPVSGNVILQAQSVDDLGNKTTAQRDVWVAGKDEWWFEVGDHDRIDLLPEKRRYEPGEKAVFQVRMPFRSGTALVTVEREGVMEAWVKKISGKNPAVEVPIKGSYAPNVFVSALVVRGRLPWIKPTAMVDLGKPAYKLGIGEIKVGWKEHELKVGVSSDRKAYKVREKAKVQVRVRTWDGKPPPSGSEVAVAAVDEGLLELMANQSWEILAAMMGRRGYSIQTSTAQMQVIGRRHFGLKALPPGGGGGKQATRELFDTLLLWKARQPLDAKGETTIEIPLNDSITSFRIVAVATGGTGLFGTGSTSIQSTQDLMILSGLPPLVREGDRFHGGFTLRNTTGRPMELDVSSKVEGLPHSLNPKEVSLSSGEAKEVGWDVVVPLNVEMLRWEVQVREKATGAGDRIQVTQKVIPAVPVRTFQATIGQLEKELKTIVERPKDGLPGRGGVRVTLRPKISDGLNGVVEYMKGYPYGCMEQKVSMAVALRDENLWKKCMSELPSHLDSDGLVKYFPPSVYGSPTLTSYVIAIGDEAGWPIPEENKEKMETGLRRFVEGSIARYSPLPTADLSIRKLAALEALSRSKKMEPKLLSSISIEPNLWPTSAVIDWFNILDRIQTIPNREERRREAEQILRSRLNLQGTVMNFSTEKSDCLWWLMVSNDVNAVRLVLSLLGSGQWKEDMPRMAQGALARQKRGRWDLTLANAWGVLAMEKFSKVFENVPVSGLTRSAIASESSTTDWNASPKGKSFLFPWPVKREELSISHQGTGKPWASVQSMAAVPIKGPLSSGYKIKKTINPVERRDPNRWSRGDILRIRLELEAQADQTWVVVSDPIPGGATVLGKGLVRDSQLLTQSEERKGWVWPAYEERSFEAFRAYYEYVPKGQWVVEYTLRLNQGGVFQLPTTRVEALYYPEMFGEIPNQPVEVRP